MTIRKNPSFFLTFSSSATVIKPMNRAKLISLSIRLANSCSATRQKGIRLFCLNQVTHLSYFSHCQHFTKPNLHCIAPNSFQNLYFSSIAESFIQIVLSNDWSDEIEDELEKLNPNLTHESVVYILGKLDRNPQKSLDFFSWVRDRKGFNPTYLPYTLMLRNFACKEFLNEFWFVASEIKEKGYILDPLFCLTIKERLELEKLDDAVEEWTEFHKSLNKGDVESDVGNKVVEVILGSDWGEVVESELEKLEFRLSEDFLFRVIRNLGQEPLKAMKFFEWVAESRKYEHSSVTYSGLATVLARCGLIGEFWDLVTRMRSEGIEIDSYPKISTSLGRFSKEDSVKLFEFMMDGPYKPSEKDCFCMLIDLNHVPEPDIDLINRVVSKYVETGNCLTKRIYDGVHRSLTKLGRIDEAKKIVEVMKNAGYKPDNITYSQEVFGLCGLQRFEDAYLVLNKMEEEGCAPDIKTWTLLIKGYCEADQVDKAMSCFAQILEKNYETDANLFAVLLNGFLAHNKLFRAYKFLVEMVNKASVKPLHATYKLMIDKLMEGGKLEEAFNVLHMMRQQDHPPYIKPIIEHISKSGTLEDAKKLLGALSMVGHVKIITSFYNRGRYTEAKDLLYCSPHRVRQKKKMKELFGGKVQQPVSPS